MMLRMDRRWSLSLVLLVPLTFGLACRRKEAPPNRLVNPSFEEGRRGWSWRSANPRWHDFEISSARAREGRCSAHLRLSPQGGDHDIWGVVQALPQPRLPESLEAWVRVENWRQPAIRQYLQIVVMAHEGPSISIPGDTTRQVRYILAGLDGPPLANPSNCRYLMRGPKVPVQGAWTHIELPLAEDFRKAWGDRSGKITKVELFFEVRYDDPVPEGETARADVYWDAITLKP